MKKRILALLFALVVMFSIGRYECPATAQDVGVEEICDDGIDNDGNGRVDCGDPVCGCAALPYCPAPPDSETSCGDGFDDDCDGMTDCDDPDCCGFAACHHCDEICDDGEDNDGNGLVDCADPFCAEICASPEVCADGIDNDQDGAVDCDDPSCAESCDCALCVTPLFLRGDANDDARVDIADAVWTVTFVFTPGGVVPCQDAVDANDDDRVDISDSVFLITYQFRGGAPPPAPFPECGVDLVGDPEGCVDPAASCSDGG